MNDLAISSFMSSSPNNATVQILIVIQRQDPVSTRTHWGIDSTGRIRIHRNVVSAEFQC